MTTFDPYGTIRAERKRLNRRAQVDGMSFGLVLALAAMFCIVVYLGGK